MRHLALSLYQLDWLLIACALGFAAIVYYLIETEDDDG